jgi:hypothetical protein
MLEEVFFAPHFPLHAQVYRLMKTLTDLRIVYLQPSSGFERRRTNLDF